MNATEQAREILRSDVPIDCIFSCKGDSLHTYPSGAGFYLWIEEDCVIVKSRDSIANCELYNNDIESVVYDSDTKHVTIELG